MIVITTPTGQVGSEILQHLVDDGEQVRVVARGPLRLPPGLEAASVLKDKTWRGHGSMPVLGLGAG